MTLRALLLLPVLFPLLTALGLGLLNRGEPARLRLLLWTTPPLPLGSLILLGAGGGAAVGAGSALLALAGSGPSEPLRRRLRRPAEGQWDGDGARDDFGPQPEQEPFEPRQPFHPEPWPDRDPYATAPTVSVPYRVVRPPSPAAAAPPAPAGDDWAQDDDGSW